MITAVLSLRTWAAEIRVCCSYFLYSELLDVQYTRLNLIAQSYTRTDQAIEHGSGLLHL